jgi:hypothetical protein
MRIARTALTGLDVILEIAESFRDVSDGSDRGVGEWSTSEIRVKDDSSGVDHAPQ